MSMANHIQERIVSASLLSHEFEQILGSSPVKFIAYTDWGRRRYLLSKAKPVLSGLTQSTEIQPVYIWKHHPGIALFLNQTGSERRSSVGMHKPETAAQGPFAEQQGDLCVFWKIADLVVTEVQTRYRRRGIRHPETRPQN